MTSKERSLLDETRKLLRQMRDDIFNHGSLSGRSQRAGEELIHRIDDALAAPETVSPQTPIVRIQVQDGVITQSSFFAPSLPDGEHNVYCEPEATAPYRDQKTARELSASEAASFEKTIARSPRRVSEKTEAGPVPHGVVYDKPGWLCSVCGFWNNVKDRHCAGIHCESGRKSMSRSGYTDDCDNLAVWRGRVASATRGKRGQAFFRALIAALDAMPEKRLIVGELESDGEVCAIGALGRARGINMSDIDPECPEQVAPVFNIAECLAQEVVYMNDEYFNCHYVGDRRTEYTPEERWQKMRRWVAEQIRVTPEEAGAVELPVSEDVKHG